MEERGILPFTVSHIQKCVTLCSKRNKVQYGIRCNCKFGEVVQMWLNSIINTVKEFIYSNYTMKTEKHILPHLGNVCYMILNLRSIKFIIDFKRIYRAAAILRFYKAGQSDSYLHQSSIGIGAFNPQLSKNLKVLFLSLQMHIISEKISELLCRHSQNVLYFPKEQANQYAAFFQIAKFGSKCLYLFIDVKVRITSLSKQIYV